jgi:PAS domain S-box-containing protein
MVDIQDRLPQAAVAVRAGSPALVSPLVTTAGLIAIYLVVGAALLPFVDDAGPELPGFNALFSGGVFVTEGVTGFLLMVVYRRQPRRSVLLLVGAYLFSALMSLGYLVAYPGAIAPGRPLMGTPQSIAWIYNSWIVGFSALTFAAVLVEVRYGTRRAPDLKARMLAVLVPASATIAALLIIAVAVIAGHRMPLLATGGVWTPLNTTLNSAAAILLTGGVVLILAALRPPRDLFLWLSLALAAIAVGNALSVFGGGRYTVGWYACRLSWLVSSGVLLLYFLGQFVRQEGQLTRATDDLEERTRERDRIWSVSEDLLGVSTFDGDFVSLNPAWEKVLGWSEAEVKGLHVDGLRHPDDAAHSLRASARLAEGAPAVRMQNRFRHKDGSWRWIAWTMTADQGLIYVAGRDVTAEKQAEEALRKAEADAAHRHKMEALGQLTGGVAHDFNNLLMIVSGYIPRLKEAVGSDLRASQAALAIESASRRGAALAAQLLATPATQSGSRRRGFHHPRAGADPAQHGRPASASGVRPRARSRDGPRRQQRVRAGAAQHRVERPRRPPAGWRRDDLRREQAARGRARAGWRQRRLRGDRGARQRTGHGAGCPVARVRSLLHDQAGGQGHRARPVAGPWLQPPVGRHGHDRQCAGKRHRRHPLPAALSRVVAQRA